MDIRTGKTYATLEEARLDGVPEADIVEVHTTKDRQPRVKFAKGPFRTIKNEEPAKN